MKKIYSLLLLAGLFLFGAQNAKAVDHLYEIGDNQGWAPASGIEMTMISSNVFEGTFVFTDPQSYFAFTSVLSSDWTAVNSNRYGGATNNQLVADGDVATLAEGNRSLTIGPGKFKIKVDINAMTATITEIPDPAVSLSSSEPLAVAGTTTTLTASTSHFDDGEIVYAYSYSTDGGTNFVDIAGTGASTTFEFGSANSYIFKVIASLNAQSATMTTTVNKLTACTIAGTSNFFGSEWNTSGEGNDMTLVNGVYTWTKSVYLNSTSSMDIQFKVTTNNSWDVSYPANNVNKTLGAGYHNVTISFDWNTKEVTYKDVSYAKVEMKASFYNDWEEVEMETALNNESCSLTYPLLAGPYNASFMISVNDGAWVGYDNTITRTNCENWTLNNSEKPCSILADVDGNYTFTFDFSDSKIDVAYPNVITRSAGNTNFQSLCVPFPATIENANVYTVESGSLNGSAVTLTPYEGNLVAGGAYIIQPKTAADVVITKVDGDATVNGQNLGGAEGLYGVLGNSYTYIHDIDASWEVYVLQSDNKFHLISDGASATIKSTKAYLHLESAVGNAPSQLRIVLGENNTTGVENIEANEKAVKFFENGQLFILRDGVVYDATGRAVR